MKDINLDDIYIINPSYKIRGDKKRCILTNNNSLLMGQKYSINEDIDDNISWRIDPYLVYILSFLDGKSTLNTIFEQLSRILGIQFSEVANSILPIIESKERKILSLKDSISSAIPKNFIIKKTAGQEYRSNILSSKELTEIINDIDMNSLRQYIPNSMILMVNNVCVTDCVYCYADKTHKVNDTIPFERVKELISEAHALGMNDFEVGGGEFLLYKHWKELLLELHKYEYSPYISTKIPISQNILDSLIECDVHGIQLSIDTVNKDEIKKILKVDDDYLPKLKQGVKLLNDANIEICVKPVITKYNDSLESIRNLIEFLGQFEMVNNINIAPGSVSIYKPFNYASNVKRLKEIEELIIELDNLYPNIRISMQGYDSEISVEDRMKSYDSRGMCSGNQSSFYALPDGKVTICEQLYWHSFFIMGDLSKQSIMEVWNSKKALSLWNFSQGEVKDGSPCKTCKSFEACRRGKGNCWRLAIAAYGIDNYDYPAPNCPLAPKATQPYYMPNM